MPTNGGNKVKFFVSVGELDLDPPSRVDKVKNFYYTAKKKGYNIKLKVYPGVGHQYTTQMGKDVFEFYGRVMK